MCGVGTVEILVSYILEKVSGVHIKVLSVSLLTPEIRQPHRASRSYTPLPIHRDLRIITK